MLNFMRLLVRQSLVTVPARGLKHKHVLQLRCDGCYFKNIDQRWHVMCTKAPRHKQVERREQEKYSYIVSERTHMGYPAFKKRYMFPAHQLD